MPSITATLTETIITATVTNPAGTTASLVEQPITATLVDVTDVTGTIASTPLTATLVNGGTVTATVTTTTITATFEGGNGNVISLGVSVDDNFASFDGITGKVIQDSGYSASSFITTANASWIDLTDGGATILHSHAGGGVTSHPNLTELDYASSGHTGFQPAGSYGDISGTGVAGQVAEFVTNTKTLQAAAIIGPASNILTLTNTAAATLALNITAAKTLTLTAADNYTLTIPATGTAALLATAQVFTAAQLIKLDSTTAFDIQNAAGTSLALFDTTNRRAVFNPSVTAPTYRVEFHGTALTDSPSVKTGLNFDRVTKPTAPTAALVAGAGLLGIGTYRYRVTYTTVLGDTDVSNAVDIVTDASNLQVLLTIPTSTDPRVTGRKIYRRSLSAAITQALLLTTISNNTATTYQDNIADASLGAVNFLSRPNTTNAGVLVDGSRAFLLDLNMVSLGVSTAQTSGGESVFIGGNVGAVVTGAANATFVGFSSGQSLTTGGNNTAAGRAALYTLATGSRNTAVGMNALYSHTGSNTTALGAEAGYLNTANGSIYLGTFAGYYQTTTANRLVIDSQSTRTSAANELTNAIIVGLMGATPSAQTLRLNAVTTVAQIVAATATITDASIIRVESTGTVAANFGGALLFQLETATADTIQTAAQIAAVWTDATNATRKAKLSLSAYDTAARLGIEIEASGTVAKLGFYGVATVVRPTALTTQLTTITATAPGTPDYAIQDLVLATGYGFVTADEGQSVLKVILNLQTRVSELETKLQGLGLLT